MQAKLTLQYASDHFDVVDTQRSVPRKIHREEFLAGGLLQPRIAPLQPHREAQFCIANSCIASPPAARPGALLQGGFLKGG